MTNFNCHGGAPDDSTHGFSESIARDLQTGHGIAPYQECKIWPKARPGQVAPEKFSYGFLRYFAGFLVGALVIVGGVGCWEFRRVALDATAHADAAQFHVETLQAEVDNLKLWSDEFTLELASLKKAVGVENTALAAAHAQKLEKATP